MTRKLSLYPPRLSSCPTIVDPPSGGSFGDTQSDGRSYYVHHPLEINCSLPVKLGGRLHLGQGPLASPILFSGSAPVTISITLRSSSPVAAWSVGRSFDAFLQGRYGSSF